ILQTSERPVVLLSAGIGATPVLAMLHALAAERSTRQILWLHAARDREHHPFTVEVRRLMLALTHGSSYVCFSRPGSLDRIGKDFDAKGRLSLPMFLAAGVPRDADVYLCGPNRFMADMKEALSTFGVEQERIHIELFNGSVPMTPGVVGATARIPHLPKDDTGAGSIVSFARSGIAAHWNPSAYQSILELAEACDLPAVGRAGQAFVTPVRAVWFRGRSSTDRSHSKSPPTATFSLAAHNRFATSSSICEAWSGARGPSASSLAAHIHGNYIALGISRIYLPTGEDRGREGPSLDDVRQAKLFVAVRRRFNQN